VSGTVAIVLIGCCLALAAWVGRSIVRSERRYAAEVAAIDERYHRNIAAIEERDAIFQAERTRRRAMAVRRISNEWLRAMPWAPVRRAA
jgi:hypothetical protein